MLRKIHDRLDLSVIQDIKRHRAELHLTLFPAHPILGVPLRGFDLSGKSLA